jgi:hypothetical protein
MLFGAEIRLRSGATLNKLWPLGRRAEGLTIRYCEDIKE